MGSFGENWGSWAATSIAASAVADAGNDITAAIDNDGKLDTEVSVQADYGATATEGLKVYVLRDTDGANYETVADDPWGFEMPYATSVTRRRTFTVPASVSSFKIYVTNDSGASVDVTVKYRQSDGVTA